MRMLPSYFRSSHSQTYVSVGFQVPHVAPIFSRLTRPPHVQQLREASLFLGVHYRIFSCVIEDELLDSLLFWRHIFLQDVKHAYFSYIVYTFLTGLPFISDSVLFLFRFFNFFYRFKPD